MSLLNVVDLTKDYYSGTFLRRGRRVRAVDKVSFSLSKGETLGLVGESGCGKSTLGRLILKLEEPTGGNVYFNEINVSSLKGEKMRQLRKKMQVIFQNTQSSLNPKLSIEAIVSEPLSNFTTSNAKERRGKVEELLSTVGLMPAYRLRYPHEFSGGERQRINIARALALNPDLIICDEPVSSLDVSVQAQILNLLKKLKEKFGLSYLFIAHDLAAVSYISDRIAVMYLGSIVEIINGKDLLDKACHPYTQALLAVVPKIEMQQNRKRAPVIQGEPLFPSIQNGCRFLPRCLVAEKKCATEEPSLQQLKSGHFIACHLYT